MKIWCWWWWHVQEAASGVCGGACAAMAAGLRACVLIGMRAKCGTRRYPSSAQRRQGHWVRQGRFCNGTSWSAVFGLHAWVLAVYMGQGRCSAQPAREVREGGAPFSNVLAGVCEQCARVFFCGIGQRRGDSTGCFALHVRCRQAGAVRCEQLASFEGGKGGVWCWAHQLRLVRDFTILCRWCGRGLVRAQRCPALVRC